MDPEHAEQHRHEWTGITRHSPFVTHGLIPTEVGGSPCLTFCRGSYLPVLS
jgi:hypothetical protein